MALTLRSETTPAFTAATLQWAWPIDLSDAVYEVLQLIIMTIRLKYEVVIFFPFHFLNSAKRELLTGSGVMGAFCRTISHHFATN